MHVGSPDTERLGQHVDHLGVGPTLARWSSHPDREYSVELAVDTDPGCSGPDMDDEREATDHGVMIAALRPSVGQSTLLRGSDQLGHFGSISS